MQVGDGKSAYKIRAASLAAGFPATTTASSLDRFCASGLKAVQDVANQIMAGDIEIGLVVGGESMTNSPPPPDPLPEEIMANKDAADCAQPMIQTSENVSTEFNISRHHQDQYAAESFRRAEVAQKAGWFDDEIVPIDATVLDSAGHRTTIVITRDEGPRYNTTVESLSKLKPAMPQFGTHTTAGNASQTTDGVEAAAILLMKRSKALELGQPVLGKYCGAAVAGVSPRIMGTGPVVAIPKLLQRFRLSQEDVDIIEINEAFASMAVYCQRALGLDHEKLNPRGGAIAIGHPLGATGARQICTILSEARRVRKQILVTSMCVGSGQGMAGLFVNEKL
ncbi:hypothetical protein H2204_002223 [Knufia peltigerae]|uniref:3-ketoacyl-CoA thiolase n=1 Tax=Knufia peltigerae TaxID=1002370 RepID=A0AA38YBX3_9EURO|nr:hypothetical protein H2204_002223 [Knufia peltigerae]